MLLPEVFKSSCLYYITPQALGVFSDFYNFLFTHILHQYVMGNKSIPDRQGL
jgi:hypothetical protein